MIIRWCPIEKGFLDTSNSQSKLARISKVQYLHCTDLARNFSFSFKNFAKQFAGIMYCLARYFQEFFILAEGNAFRKSVCFSLIQGFPFSTAFVFLALYKAELPIRSFSRRGLSVYHWSQIVVFWCYCTRMFFGTTAFIATKKTFSEVRYRPIDFSLFSSPQNYF